MTLINVKGRRGRTVEHALKIALKHLEAFFVLFTRFEKHCIFTFPIQIYPASLEILAGD